MSFALDWLDLREPADHAARDAGLMAAAAAHASAAPRPLVVDLGAGSGSTLRAFGARGMRWRWRLVDRDAALLAAARARHPGVEVAAGDIAEVDKLPLGGARLVTASALFDLVSGDWLPRLADRLAAARIGLYAALSYDGAMVWQPEVVDDAEVVAAFNADQRRDKGFGPALGPNAAGVLAAAMAARGYRVRRAASPWRLRPGPLQAALVEGVAAAAAAPDWGQARRAAATAGASCTVGHVDVLALPG